MSKFYSAEPVPVICSFDPAIDEEETGQAALAEYVATRNVELLKMRDGVKPSVYWVGRITTTQYAQINRVATTEAHRHELAFMLGLTKAESVECADGVHRPEIIPKYIKNPQPKQARQLTAAEFDLFDPDVIYEIGAVAYSRAPLLRGKAVFFVLPRSSAHALQRMDLSSRLAAILSPGTPDSTEHSTGSEKKPSPSGVEPGPATVTASPT